MLGYFILKEKAEELGLLSNPTISAEMQETIVAITNKDLLDEINITLSEEQLKEIASWFYKNYYDCFIETVQNWIEKQR
jgi:hypothetical protein